MHVSLLFVVSLVVAVSCHPLLFHLEKVPRIIADFVAVRAKIIIIRISLSNCVFVEWSSLSRPHLPGPRFTVRRREYLLQAERC